MCGIFCVFDKYSKLNISLIIASFFFSGKEYFIFEDTLSNQSNTFTEQWSGEEKSFLIANTVDYELILFSENSYQDFSKNLINDFPVEVILSSSPYSITIKKYLPKN